VLVARRRLNDSAATERLCACMCMCVCFIYETIHDVLVIFTASVRVSMFSRVSLHVRASDSVEVGVFVCLCLCMRMRMRVRLYVYACLLHARLCFMHV
jgi:hypothetical protein